MKGEIEKLEVVLSADANSVQVPELAVPRSEMRHQVMLASCGLG